MVSTLSSSVDTYDFTMQFNSIQFDNSINNNKNNRECNSNRVEIECQFVRSVHHHDDGPLSCQLETVHSMH